MSGDTLPTRVLIAGGAGLIGEALARQLSEKGHLVYVLSRKNREADDERKIQVRWDGRTVPLDALKFEAVINLSGVSLADHRWTKKFRASILRSRVESTKALVTWIDRSEYKPSVFLNASAVGYYGHRPGEELTEEAGMGLGFLPEVVNAWERSADVKGVRTVLLRTGVVLSRRGGALPRLVAPLRAGFSVWFGHGRQYLPWIHIDDEVAAILFCLENKTLSGPVNLVSPQGATGREAARRLRIAKHGCCSLPVPSFLLKVLMGERSRLLLDDQRVIPEKLIRAGFHFRYEKLEDAFGELFGK